MGGLDGNGSRPVGVCEVAVKEDCSETGKDTDEWKEVVHRTLLLLERGTMEADLLPCVRCLGEFEDVPVGLAALLTGMCIQMAWRFNPSFGG